MRAGSINQAVESELARIRERSFGGGSPPGLGGNGGRNKDGGDWKRELIDTEEQNSEKSRVITWVVLLVVLMTFGGLIGAYIVIATNKVLEWQPFSLPVAVWISTALIIVSSLTFYFGHRAILHNDEPRIRKYLVATTALGGMFIASQLISWIALASRGLYVQGNPYAGFFYILTAIHAVHVLGGIIALGVVVLRAWYVTGNETETTYRQRLSTAVSWYWHFMGAIWIVLFLLLGFWR